MIASLIALGIGGSIVRPNPEVAAEIGTIQRRLKVYPRLALGFLLFAVLAMSVARYL